jgi:hypothetical protein
MANQFGEKISDQAAYDTARAATKDMSTASLNQQASQQMGPNQAQAVQDELAERGES